MGVIQASVHGFLRKFCVLSSKKPLDIASPKAKKI
jgi:hypothetical protein